MIDLSRTMITIFSEPPLLPHPKLVAAGLSRGTEEEHGVVLVGSIATECSRGRNRSMVIAGLFQGVDSHNLVLREVAVMRTPHEPTQDSNHRLSQVGCHRLDLVRGEVLSRGVNGRLV